MNMFTRTFFLFILATGLLFSPAVFSEDLLSLYSDALRNDPVLQTAEAEYQANLQQKPIARSSLLPQVGYSASYFDVDQTYEDASALFTDADFKRNSQEIEIRQALFRWDLINKFSEAEFNVSAAEAKIKSVRQEHIYRVVSAYIDVLKAQNNDRLAKLETKVLKTQLDQTNVMRSEGFATITDLYQYQAKYDLAVSKTFETADLLTKQRTELSRITGHLPIALDGLKLKEIPFLKSLTSNNVSDLINRSLRQNPDIRQSRFKYLAAEQQWKAERSKHLPTLDFKASYSEQDEQGGFNRGKSSDSRFGVELEVPIFSGMETIATASQAKHLLVKAKKEYLGLKKTQIAKVRQTFSRIQNGQRKMTSLLRAHRSTRQSLDGTRKAAKLGTRTSSDVYLAIKDVHEARRNYAEARYDLLVDAVQLKFLAGELSPATVNQIIQ